MNIKSNYRLTSVACVLGFVTQAADNIYLPLLFVTIHNQYGVSLSQLTGLITIYFFIQLVIDYIAGRYAERIGIRACLVFACACNTIGMLTLAFTPFAPSDAYVYPLLLIGNALNAIGGGTYEVLMNPTFEACPRDNKPAGLALLHSSYCFGLIGTILLSTLYFYLFGRENWAYLTMFWTLLPLSILIMFSFVPIGKLVEDDKKMTFFDVLKNRTIWIFIILMIASGASELAMSQWASAFAEASLGIDKTTGDILGTCLFASAMALSRVLGAKMSDKYKIEHLLTFSAFLCCGCYLAASLSKSPALSLAACVVCGVAVAMMWPGTLSLSEMYLPNGGTAMFAVLALAGDIGCTVGPSVVGYVSETFGNDLKIGFLFALVFPIMMIVGVLLLERFKRKRRENQRS